MSSHCCRVMANVTMLLALLLWLQVTTNSQAEYFLGAGIKAKLTKRFGLFGGSSGTSEFREYMSETMLDLYYPGRDDSTT